MKLRATFVIEVDADGFIQAADFQQRFAEELHTLKGRYDTVSLDFRECRGRRTPGLPTPNHAPPTGRVRSYGM